MNVHPTHVRTSSLAACAILMLLGTAACGAGSVSTPASTFDAGREGGDADAGLLDGSKLLQGDGSTACTPTTCAALGASCGPQGDGCGGTLSCGTCSAPETCGGGGTPSVCGGDNGCHPATCAAKGVDCGPLSDGCGGLLQCGSCAAGQVCGVKTPGVCGPGAFGPDGGPINPCVPGTCGDLGLTCGPAGDGCGGTLSCGSCVSPASCGGGGAPSVCGGSDGCVPKTCAALGASCGTQGDGCGGTLSCGSCAAPETCGGGGTPNVCGGAQACVSKTCAQLGFDCGEADDGCGNVLQCGASCPAGQVCGGGGAPNACGPKTPLCTGLCLQQQACAAPATTSLSGTVYAPNGADPLYNALVYVPNAPVEPFTPGVACETCSAAVSGSPLVSVYTGYDGTFTLANVPVGANIPLVIQLGRWRRQVVVPSVTACVDNPVPASLTNMPTNRGVGDIPRMAFVTGNVDALECVFRKIGIDDGEFGDADGPNRLQIYTGNGSPGASYSSSTLTESSLWGTQAQIDQYDMVLFACQGGQYLQAPADQQTVVNFANAGGRVFATHYNYVWLDNVAPFSQTASWAVDPNNDHKFAADPATGHINQSFPAGAALAQWLKLLYPNNTLGEIAINTLRDDFTGVAPASNLWVTVSDANLGTVPLHYSFDTPVAAPAAQQCGRVVFEDYHVESASKLGTQTFPGECAAGPMTPQEKLLEFELFDLSSCVGPVTPTCTPRSCSDQGFDCGQQGDGCGNLLDCGSCAAPETCGGGGAPGVCGGTTCVPLTCAAQGISCGPAGDGCGGALDCGACPSGQACGAGGVPGVCGATGCVPTTCLSQGKNCGPVGDGCGGSLDCGVCPSGQACGAGGVAGVCGALPDAAAWKCVPRSCADLGQGCGPAGDGCGGLLECGTCQAPETCGGGGVAGQCGGHDCTPITCQSQHISCGPAGDGCGGVLSCGSCTAPKACGVGGTPGVCGVPSTPR